jgi:tetratricopeptide (TPR) repeat protein
VSTAQVVSDYGSPTASVSPGLTWHVKGQAPQRAVRKEFYTTTPVRYSSGPASLSGSLLMPIGPGPHPAIVMIHGSGPVTREALMPYADVFVRNGIAVLIHDKRGTGSSTGNWARATFDDLADDALAGVKLLKGRPEINPAQIGLQGTSLGGWVAPGALDQYARALELCAKVADVSDDPLVGADAIRALIGIWTWYCTKGDLAELGEVSDTIERQLRLTPMAAGLPVLASCRGVERFYAGDFPASRRLLEQAVSQLATDDIPDWERWQIPNDPMAAAYAFLGPLRLVMGDEPGALAAIAAGLERSATLPPPHGAFSEAFVRTYEVWMHRARGALDDARRAGQELLDVTREHGELVLWAIVAQLHLAATEVMAEPTPAALGRLGAAISAYRGLGVEVTVPSFLLEQAAGHLALGEPDEAGRCVDDALSYADQRYARAEGLRLRAEVRAARSGQRDRRGVHGDLCEALRIATAQEAPFQLARVVDSYRRLVGGDPPSVRITTGMTRGVRSW